MSKSFIARLPLAATALDRDYLNRDSEEAIDLVRGDPTTRYVVLRDQQALLATPTALARLEAPPDGELLVYLGRTLSDGAGLFVVVVPADADLEGEWGDLRSLGTSLDAEDAGIFVAALAVTNWHAATAFSPVSGSPTRPSKG